MNKMNNLVRNAELLFIENFYASLLPLLYTSQAVLFISVN